MKQITFADTEYAGKRKQTHKELFLIEMDQVVPLKGLIASCGSGHSTGVDDQHRNLCLPITSGSAYEAAQILWLLVLRAML